MDQKSVTEAILPAEGWTVEHYERQLVRAMRIAPRLRGSWHATLINLAAEVTDPANKGLKRECFYFWLAARLGGTDLTIGEWCRARGISRSKFDRRRERVSEACVEKLQARKVPLRNPNPALLSRYLRAKKT